MDIQIPEMDGYAATAKYESMKSKCNPHLPILALTANAYFDEQEKSFSAGCDSHYNEAV